MPNQTCPICKKEVAFCYRHPKYVCKWCLAIHPAVNSKGQEVSFRNESLSGGFLCDIISTGEVTDDHICYVNGVKCWADEYRFGGIVVEVMENK